MLYWLCYPLQRIGQKGNNALSLALVSLKTLALLDPCRRLAVVDATIKSAFSTTWRKGLTLLFTKCTCLPVEITMHFIFNLLFTCLGTFPPRDVAAATNILTFALFAIFVGLWNSRVFLVQKRFVLIAPTLCVLGSNCRTPNPLVHLLFTWLCKLVPFACHFSHMI